MTTGSLTVRSGCKACGAQPSPTATTQPMWCEACGDCFTCGEPNAVATLVAHQCPGGTAAVHLSASQLSVADWPASSVRWLLSDILASGPISPGYQHSTATHVEGREAPKRELLEPDDHKRYRYLDFAGMRVRVDSYRMAVAQDGEWEHFFEWKHSGVRRADDLAEAIWAAMCAAADPAKGAGR